MKYDPLSFGKSDRTGWQLRAVQRRRREARNAALVCAAITILCSVGAGVADAFGNVGGAVVLGLFAALAIVVGTVAASEA